MRIGIIGAGAAGITAAIVAKNKNNDVTVIDHSRNACRKLSITGNGSCNLSNLNMDPNKYYGEKSFLDKVLGIFSEKDLISWLYENGIMTYNRDGYVYPLSMEAKTVSGILLDNALKSGVKIKCNNKIKSIAFEDGNFTVDTGIISCFDRLLIATGGRSYPDTGSNGSGYAYAKQFGHNVINAEPALVPVCCNDDPLFRKADGVRANGTAACRGICERGNIQITNYGLSGIPIFNISRNIYPGDSIVLDFSGGMSAEDITGFIKKRINSAIISALCGIINKKIALAVLERAEISSETLVYDLCDKTINEIAGYIISYDVIAKKRMGFDRAQVTKGGVSTREVDPNTMESRLKSGLYFAGEILDVDGICGGYNLQFAFSTGYIAGRSMIL